MAVWSGSYTASLSGITLAEKAFWLNMMFIGVDSVPVFFLIFVLEFTNRGRWLTPRHFVLYLTIPVVSLLLQWTNDLHHLVFLAPQTIELDNLLVLQYVRGPWYYVGMAYSYMVIGLGLTFLVISTVHSSPLMRSHYYQILLTSFVPMLTSLYSELSSSGPPVLDLLPLSFGFCGVLFAFAYVRNQFLEVIPVARNRLIENMSDGVLVLDANGRIVDINPAMAHILDIERRSHMGKNASEVLKDWSEQINSLWNHNDTHTELRLPRQPSSYMDLRMTPLYDRKGNLNGRMIVFRDITDRKRAEKDLLKANDRLYTQLIEIGLLQSQLREQAIRDHLTNLFNRRYLEETLERELSRAEREKYPLCLVMMDIDHFKDVNDTYGHEAGDIVLRSLADTVTANSRHGDFACRFGGEEIVLVMPNIGIESATERAEELHRMIEGQFIHYGRFHLSITVSVGIACYPSHGVTKEELLRAADKALYAAKHAGRNRVCVYFGVDSREMKELDVQ